MMAANIQKAAETFMDALHKLEADGDAAAIVDAFADDAVLMALVSHRTHTGRDGVEAFWREYLKPFEDIHSEFTHVATAGDQAILEWTGRGRLAATDGNARDFEYEGCSLLEFNEAGKVKRFRTFYDSAAFVHVEAGAK